jgi:hypothetical protein
VNQCHYKLKVDQKNLNMFKQFLYVIALAVNVITIGSILENSWKWFCSTKSKTLRFLGGIKQ